MTDSFRFGLSIEKTNLKNSRLRVEKGKLFDFKFGMTKKSWVPDPLPPSTETDSKGLNRGKNF